MRSSRTTTTVAVLAVFAVALMGQLAIPTPVEAQPTATDAGSYSNYGRVFPDPQGCMEGAPGTSPFAEGNVCAVDFLQFGDVQPAFEFMGSVNPVDYPELYPEGGRHFGEFLEFQTLHEDFAHVLDLDAGEGMSAGLAQPDGSRQRFPLHQIKVTDSRSDIPESEREHFIFSLSVHGIERAGVEGGLRAVEDLVTWAATQPDRPLMVSDPTRTVSIGETLRRSVIYFALPNPDGWMRGETTGGGPFYMRYNGNGIDLNRDWPSQGYTFRPFAPHSEPESRSFAKVWKHIRSEPWTGGNDLHGMLDAPAFSYTLIGGVKRPFDKNDAAVNTMRKMWADQENRLTWSTLIKENTEPGEDPRMYGVQWGTIWDTIDYTVTGAMGDWFDSPLGLDALGLDNEMALSHLGNCGIGKCYSQEVEQLHVDGNKGLIYAQINEALRARQPVFRQPGRTAFVTNPNRVRNPGSPPPSQPGNPDLPPQDDISGTATPDPDAQSLAFNFDVLGPEDGHFNGGLTVTVTASNVQGVSPGAVTGIIVERFGLDPHDESNADEGWHEVNAYYNQSPAYLQAGMTVPVNAPEPGEWRVRLENPPPSIYSIEIQFTSALAWPDPGQIAYDVSNTDFFRDLDPHALEGFGFTGVSVDAILSGQLDLSLLDSLVLSDDFMPGSYTDAQRDAYIGRLLTFVREGGNLVLTDGAMAALQHMSLDGEQPFAGTVGEGEEAVPTVRPGPAYAGHVLFNDGEGPTYDRFDLAKEINQAGTAEGGDNRRQTGEPVPVGFSIGDGFLDGPGNYPVWRVDRTAWEDAGGSTVGIAGTGQNPAYGEGQDVTYGELPLGRGVVRVVGSLLPTPTEEFDHPYGLGAYGVTFSGYQVLHNMMQWVRPGGTWRLAGANRFETSTEVALRHWNVTDTVVIASGGGFADALAAVPLAKALDAPILLSPAAGLEQTVYDYLLARNPQPTRAFVIGGEAALSEQVVDDLKRVYIPEEGITRIGGATRFETAVEVAKALEEINGATPTKAVVATGERFPDALAAGPVAANLGPERAAVPLLLTASGSVPPVVAEYLADRGISETLVAGGSNAIADAAVATLPSPTRVAGLDRFATATLLADRLAILRDGRLSAVTLATGTNFPDALVVGSPGGRDGIATILTVPTALGPAFTRDWLESRARTLRTVYIAGGNGAVSPAVGDAVERITGRR